MIFQKDKKILLLFSENKVNVIRYVWKGSAYLIESQKIVDTANEVQNAELTSEKLKNVYVFIPEEQNYFKLLTFESTQKISKLEIVKEIENYIPEKAEERNIYWEKIGKNENESIISARVIKNEYMSQIMKYLQKTRIEMVDVFFESDLVAEARIESEVPEIVLTRKKEKVLIMVTNKGKIWQTILVEVNKEKEVIEQIKIDFESKWKMKLEKVSEEKNNILEMIQFRVRKKDNYLKTADFLFAAIIIISVIVLVMFVPLILKNVELNQKSLNLIQNIDKK